LKEYEVAQKSEGAESRSGAKSFGGRLKAGRRIKGKKRGEMEGKKRRAVAASKKTRILWKTRGNREKKNRDKSEGK